MTVLLGATLAQPVPEQIVPPTKGKFFYMDVIAGAEDEYGNIPHFCVQSKVGGGLSQLKMNLFFTTEVTKSGLFTNHCSQSYCDVTTRLDLLAAEAKKLHDVEDKDEIVNFEGKVNYFVATKWYKKLYSSTFSGDIYKTPFNY